MDKHSFHKYFLALYFSYIYIFFFGGGGGGGGGQVDKSPCLSNVSPNDCHVRYYRSEPSTQHCLQCIFLSTKEKKQKCRF